MVRRREGAASSHIDALDDRHEGGKKSGARRAVRFSRVVPALLVSALHFRSAPRVFAGRCQGLDQGFFLHVVEYWALTGVDRLKGKFRSF